MHIPALKLVDQDKLWTPHVICKTCTYESMGKWYCKDNGISISVTG